MSEKGSKGRRTRQSSTKNGQARLEDVALLAGVSTATVSRAINDPEKVSEPMRQRVLEAASRLGWIPNAAGRALASSRTQIAGAIIPTLDTEIFARQTSAMQAVFAERGYTLFLGCTNYDPAMGHEQVRAMLARGVEAVAIVGEDYPPDVFAMLARYRVPYVVTYAYRADSAHPCIGVDQYAAFRRITRELLNLGHHCFAAIFQPQQHNRRVADRIAGFTDELASAGLTIEPDRMSIGPASIEWGAAEFARLMAQSPKQRPTAIVCGNDLLAIGALDAARRLGLRPGFDVSITGFDDIAFSSRMVPGLTTQWVDNHLIGDLAARSLLKQIDDPIEKIRSVEIRPDLRLRGSTGPTS